MGGTVHLNLSSALVFFNRKMTIAFIGLLSIHPQNDTKAIKNQRHADVDT
jgi:hypothetical protein